jgi:antitoxin component YwqK of YwqJK toxin-antitoxin module
MSLNHPKIQHHFEYHKDGSIWGKGQILDGKPDGYSEWFRKDGSIMHSGHFLAGKQVGEWTTYDLGGKIHKVTTIKADKS